MGRVGDRPGRHARVLVLGDPGGVGDALVRKLELAGASGVSAPTRSDSEAAEVLSDEEWTAVAVLTHDDVEAEYERLKDSRCEIHPGARRHGIGQLCCIRRHVRQSDAERLAERRLGSTEERPHSHRAW